jgi:hypothetical protein
MMAGLGVPPNIGSEVALPRSPMCGVCMGKRKAAALERKNGDEPE